MFKAILLFYGLKPALQTGFRNANEFKRRSIQLIPVKFFTPFRASHQGAFVFALTLCASGLVCAQTDDPTDAPPAPDYLAKVRVYADTMLEKGTDHYGAQTTPMWASVIDTRTWTAPQKDVAPPAGIRPGDRALGGSNFYHDAVTTRVLNALSEASSDARYRAATDNYAAYFLAHAQNPDSGLLGWGEHIFYDIYGDRVTAQPDYLKQEWGGVFHELIEWTPPWDELWENDSQATTKAIAALRWHFYGEAPQSLYNRHAFWDVAGHEQPGGQPWIKHSALYAYSFAFLGAKTGDAQWTKWSQGAANLFWERRNPQTNLTLSCIDDPREDSRNASMGQTQWAYWTLKVAQLGGDDEMRSHALTMLKAYDRYFYNARNNSYRTSVALDGTPVKEAPIEIWSVSYGEPNLATYGRVAAYFAQSEKDDECVQIARRVAQLTAATPLPDQVSLEALAFALNLNLDLFDLTGEKIYLQDAQNYADQAVARFWVQNGGGGSFVRAQGDPYYEAKVGVGDLLSGLLRLDGRLNKRPDPKNVDWSF